MPIDYSKYPCNWKKEIVPRIKERAQHCCEFCSLPNYSQVYSYKQNGITVWESAQMGAAPPTAHKIVKVILTVAHLDHDEQNPNIKDDRLRALCQLCHLRYDAAEKAKRRKAKLHSTKK